MIYIFFANSSDTRPGLVSSKTARKHHLEKKNKESNAKNLVKPKAQIEHEKREEGLQAAISSSNKGFALLAKMGYKPGMGIGKTGLFTDTIYMTSSLGLVDQRQLSTTPQPF